MVRPHNKEFDTLVLERSFAAMIDSVSKPKLAKGLSYVLKTSQLAKALSDAGIECHVDLVFWVPQTGGSILEGHYWLPNENMGYPAYMSALGSSLRRRI